MRRAAARAAAALSANWCLLAPGREPPTHAAWHSSTLDGHLRSFVEGAVSAVVLTQNDHEARAHGGRVRGVVTGSRGSVFIKAVDSEKNAAHLSNEARMLQQLGPGVAPELLHEHIEADAGFIVTEAVQPDYRRPSLTPDTQGIALLEALPRRGMETVDDHPWTAGVIDPECPSDVVRWCEKLRSRKWPRVVLHGDFAPNHLASRQGGGPVLMDWEYGSMDGFPGVDAASWVIRVGAMLQDASADTVSSVFTSWACGRDCSGVRMTRDEARAILALTAYWYRDWAGVGRGGSLRASLWAHDVASCSD